MLSAVHTTSNLLGNELKFLLPAHRAPIIRHWLDQMCISDDKYPSAIISSIYFDTRQWHFLKEKIHSDYLKTKVRIRWYMDIHGERYLGPAFIETKYRVGYKRRKFRFESAFNSQWLASTCLDSQELMQIPNILRSKGVLLDNTIYPVFIIRYKRYRYLEPVSGTRICLDYDICAPKINPQMLPHQIGTSVPEAVFEVKGNQDYLPEFLYPLTNMGCRRSSFSKYSACYQAIMGVVL